MSDFYPLKVVCRGSETQKVGKNLKKLTCIKGFCQVKKIPKSEKNSEVGGWVKPQLAFFFLLEMVYFVCFLCCFLLLYMFPKSKFFSDFF